ncbi:hypothetical protein [Bradyrhizobium sp. SZCCHNG3015]|uniref:hypothetical protein n=1 Tax=Bradyrhizobium sp. SZCCHNG3015 TaxID=3057270 RepID=UPI0028F00074|nr:hypothetical protein [Bradyrhizobium sp. SZCCHNG3015]
MTGFSVTFERYLPHDDADEICEADEIGFVVESVSLRDAIRIGLEYARPSWCGVCEPDSYPARSVRWISFYQWNDGTREFFEWIRESRALHIPNHVTDASRSRICRLFGIKS